MQHSPLLSLLLLTLITAVRTLFNVADVVEDAFEIQLLLPIAFKQPHDVEFMLI